jgi:hypothetical protein
VRSRSARNTNRNTLHIRNSYTKDQHLKNITKLLHNITREKSNQERIKDPHDFMAYPTLFFRTVANGAPVKRKRGQKKFKTMVEPE